MRILIVHPGALGDLLLALPAIISLRARRSPCSITVMAGSSFLSFLQHHRVADSTISVDSQALAALCAADLDSDTRWGAFYAGFDIVIAWMEDSDGMMEYSLRALGVPHVFMQSPRGAERLRVPVSEWYLSSVEQFCDRDIFDLPIVKPTEQELEMGVMILREANVLPTRNRIFAIHPGSGSIIKNWDLHRFIDVLLYITEMPGISPLVLCGPADEAVLCSLMASTRIGACAGLPVLKDLSLLQLVGVLGHCAAFIGNDSGVTHLAAGIGVLTMAVFGPTNPMLWAPSGAHVQCFRGCVRCHCQTATEKKGCHRPCFPEDADAVKQTISAMFCS